jgi:non-ribosomal peptide synthetase component E (peptide arylation enzyme)
VKSVPWGSDLCAIASRYADRIAVRDRSGEIRYRMLFRKAAALAHTLQVAGATIGEPVITFFRNGIPAVWARYGVLLSGCRRADQSRAERGGSSNVHRDCQTATSSVHTKRRALLSESWT